MSRLKGTKISKAAAKQADDERAAAEKQALAEGFICRNGVAMDAILLNYLGRVVQLTFRAEAAVSSELGMYTQKGLLTQGPLGVVGGFALVAQDGKTGGAVVSDFDARDVFQCVTALPPRGYADIVSQCMVQHETLTQAFRAKLADVGEDSVEAKELRREADRLGIKLEDEQIIKPA